MRKTHTNWFPTLSAALAAEKLEGMWPEHGTPIAYSESRGWTYDDGTKYGHYVSIYRNEVGLYERPVHYARG